MVTITIRGREIPLAYTTEEMLTIQEEIAPLEKTIRLATGRNPEDEDDVSWFGGAEHLKAISALARILGNAGLEERGEEPDLTDRKIRKMLRPDQLSEMINACLDAMAEGMKSEIPKEVKTGPVDVGLEEIEKKKEREG